MTSKLFFEGYTATGNGVLWVSSGTAASAKPITFRNQDPNGFLAPGSELGQGYGIVGPDILAAYGMVFLDGLDAGGSRGLFVYNSVTGAATEVMGAVGNNGAGLSPDDFVAYAGKVYFDGYDSNLDHALWVTNGTTAGTKEIAGSPSLPSSMAVYKGELYMDGGGADGFRDLFAYSATTGKFAELAKGLDPQGVTALAVGAIPYKTTGNVLPIDLFMNGQVGNVRELVAYSGSVRTNISVQAANGGLDPDDLVGLTWIGGSATAKEFEGAAFFAGVDTASLHRGVWESTGSSATRVVASSAGGSANGLDPYDLTAFDQKLYFTGNDKYSNGRGLFVYNPATHAAAELIKSTSLDLTDGYFGGWGALNQSTLSVFAGKLYFGAANPNVGGAASVPQLYEYSGSGSTATLLSIGGVSSSGLAPGSFAAL